MMKERLVSIIIPVYNGSKNILETLKSVHNLSYKNYECIVIDDGSVDNSETLIKNFISEKEKFKLI